MTTALFVNSCGPAPECDISSMAQKDDRISSRVRPFLISRFSLFTAIASVAALVATVLCSVLILHFNPVKREQSENGPVVDMDFADPTIIQANGRWYAFTARSPVDCEWIALQRDQHEHILVKTGSTAPKVHAPGGADVSRDGSKIVFHGDLQPEFSKGKISRWRGMYAADFVHEDDGLLELGKLRSPP